MNLTTFANVTHTKHLLATALICAPIMLAGCGGSSSGDSDANTTVSGQANKGPVSSATVSVYALASNGDRGELLASTTTDVSGNFSLSVDHAGATEVVVTGGTYYDEATGMSVALEADTELRTFLESTADIENVAVTALTTIAAAHAEAQANAASSLDTAIASANTEVATAFGLSGVDITETIPADLSTSASAQASATARRYGAVQAGMTQLIETEGLAANTVLTLVEEMAADFSDGEFDGMSASGALNFSLSITPQQAMTGLDAAMAAFLNSSENLSGMTEVNITIPDVGSVVTQ